MRKTIFLTEVKEIKSDRYIMSAPYIFYGRGKWRQDEWYFNNVKEVAQKARALGYLIK